VKIELSRDGNWADGDGSDVELLAASLDASLGAWEWTVTGPASVNCVIRVSEVGDPSTSDESDAFEIGPDVTPPTVVSTSPAHLQVEVMLGAAVTVAFSDAMDRTATEAAFSLSAGPGVAVEGSFSWPDDATMVFTRSALLADEGFYTVTIETGACDLSGNAVEAVYTTSFATRSRVGGMYGGGGCSAGGGGPVLVALVLPLGLALALARRRGTKTPRAPRAPR
jgi:hypothetical protein